MKKIVLLLLLVTGFAHGQECNFEINEVDAFTKLKKTKTIKQVVAVTTSSSISVSFFKNNNTYLEMYYHTSGIKSIVIGSRDVLSLMFQDDSIVELLPIEIVSGEFDVLNNTNVKSKYPIAMEIVTKIRTVGLKKVRFNSTKYYYDFDVTKEKWISKLNNQIDCFLKEVL
jgi:hypothetical protein